MFFFCHFSTWINTPLNSILFKNNKKNICSFSPQIRMRTKNKTINSHSADFLYLDVFVCLVVVVGCCCCYYWLLLMLLFLVLILLFRWDFLILMRWFVRLAEIFNFHCNICIRCQHYFYFKTYIQILLKYRVWCCIRIFGDSFYLLIVFCFSLIQQFSFWLFAGPLQANFNTTLSQWF